MINERTKQDTKGGDKPALDSALVEVLDWIATQASVSVATLRLAVKELSFEKNLSRRRIKKVLDENNYDISDLRKRIIKNERRYGRHHE